jgi:hypothetical protein
MIQSSLRRYYPNQVNGYNLSLQIVLGRRSNKHPLNIRGQRKRKKTKYSLQSRTKILSLAFNIFPESICLDKYIGRDIQLFM